jgi:hypothetical protein
MNDDDAKLQEIAKRLGARAAERLDVAQTARAVLERLREQPAAPSAWVQPAWLRIAAALVILVGGAVGLRQVWRGYGDDHAAHFVADDLRDLSADQLRDVLATLDETLTRDSTALPDGSGDIDELDAQQLRAVLRSLEG